MGIQRIESITYGVDDLPECVRFFQDMGLTLVESDDSRAVFETLVKQTVRLETDADSSLPPPVESSPTIREAVWGVDTQDELDRLVDNLAADRTVRHGDDGVYHTHDETGFGLGLTLARADGFEPAPPRPSNTMGRVERWNAALEEIEQVRPLRICHLALNIPKAGSQEAIDFYIDRLGFTATDVVKPMGTFLQCEGDDDQHNFLLCHRPDKAGMNHIALEVPGFDDVIEGANHMIGNGWREARRLGRHTIGSNVFRFVHAPCGGRVEFAADMDRADDSYGTRVHETIPPHHIWSLQSSRENVHDS